MDSRLPGEGDASYELEQWVPGLRDLKDPVAAPHASYRAVWQRLLSLVTGCERAKALRVGTSVSGQPLWAITVDPPRESAAPVFVIAGLHAMEHVGVETAVSLLERAAASATPWQSQRLVVVPIANPDGFLAVERGLAAGGRRFWRKNANRVDLNRNFAEFWSREDPFNRFLPGIFSPGAEPLSEPETAAVDRLVARTRPRYAVSLHAFGEYIFLPFAGSREPTADHDTLVAIASAMAERQPHRAYRVSQLGSHSRFFRARGAEIDHFYRRYGALSFLFEIGAGPRLSSPETWLQPYRWFTPPAELLAADVDNVLPAIEYLAEL